MAITCLSDIDDWLDNAMKIIIPVKEIRERLLPYDDILNKCQVSHDMIYNVACYGIQTCLEHNNFSDAFVRDKADLSCWEVFSETVMEVFGEDLSYAETEAAITVCSKATVEVALEISKHMKNFDHGLIKNIADQDGYIYPMEDDNHNLILEVVRSENNGVI